MTKETKNIIDEIKISEEIINIFEKHNCSIRSSIIINNAVQESLMEDLEKIKKK